MDPDTIKHKLTFSKKKEKKILTIDVLEPD